MSQKQKLDELIKKIIKEELQNAVSEEEKEYVTSDGTAKTATSTQKQAIAKAKAGDTIKYRKAGTSTTSTTGTVMEEESEEMEVADTEVLESVPTATELSGKLSEVIDALSRITEGGKDEKHKKYAAKVMKAMESAKTALEALTAHEMMLEEKEKEAEKKDAEKHIKGFKKHLTKLVKEPGAVEKIAAKLTPEKMADLKKKMKSGELDEEKLARVMLQHSLKEGWVEKASVINELQGEKLGGAEGFVYIVDAGDVEDIVYGTKWLKALPLKKMESLIKKKHLFYTIDGRDKYLLFVDGNDIIILNKDSEVVDSSKSKKLTDAERVVKTNVMSKLSA